jgi:hypothetical protein
MASEKVCHLSLEKDAPEPRAIQAADLGDAIEISKVGGLHLLSLDKNPNGADLCAPI